MPGFRHLEPPRADRCRTAIVGLVFALLSADPADAIRLCMLPLDVPFEKEDERYETLERLVTRHFEGAAVGIAPSAAVRKTYEKAVKRFGAVFDPATGEVDVVKQEKFDREVERSMREEHDCSGFVRLSLTQVAAWYGGVSARWDGRTRQVNSSARVATQVLVSVLAGVVIVEQGFVPALSLLVQVTDLRDEDVAFRSAGIETLNTISLSRGHDYLPEDRWLRDEEALEEAVTLALGDDIEKLRSSGRPPGVGAPAFRWD